jgi:hypothetical protein
VCIDAADYRPGGAHEQYREKRFCRELSKVYAGLVDLPNKTFCTGNWGCGVFRGDILHKAVLQWMAASVVGMSVAYLPFGDKNARRLPELVALIGSFTVAQAYDLLLAYDRAQNEDRHLSFADFCVKQIRLTNKNNNNNNDDDDDDEITINNTNNNNNNNNDDDDDDDDEMTIAL